MAMQTQTNSRKKICYILPEYKEDTDSHFSYLYDFIDALSRDADIFLIVEKGNKIAAERFSRAVCVQKLHVRFLPLRALEEFFVLVRARLRGYRIFYTHYSYTGALLSSAIARLTGGKAYYWNCGMPWLYGRQLSLRFVLRSVHFLVTGTVTMRDLYVKEYGLLRQKIFVSPNWIDLGAYASSEEKKDIRKRLHLPIDKNIILFAHRLSERKGADKIVDMASLLSEESAVFVIAGDGPLFEDIKKSVERRNLEKQILLLGKIPHKDIAPYFFAADVFIMPSREEGFPHVLLEAMAAGVPFVASTVGGVRDIVPVVLQKYCVKDVDEESFSERVRELLQSEKDRMDIAEIEKEHVKKYSLDAVKAQFLGMF